MENSKKPVIHFEIGCDHLNDSIAFYRNVFQWNISQEGSSAAINTGSTEGIPGHITALGHEPHKYINIYIQTEEIDVDLKRIEACGGKKVVGPITLPDGRTFAWFQDVAGNTLGLITPFS